MSDLSQPCAGRKCAGSGCSHERAAEELAVLEAEIESMTVAATCGSACVEQHTYEGRCALQVPRHLTTDEEFEALPVLHLNDFHALEARTMDLDRFNSATKYPSIETYHALGERGSLTEVPMEFQGPVVLTEKVNGTNGRIVLLPSGDYFIGSREHLLYAKGDRVINPDPVNRATVEALKPLAERLASKYTPEQVTTFYLEVYGHKIGAATKEYTSTTSVGYRLFDIAWTDWDVLEREVHEIAMWRDHFGPEWFEEPELLETAEKLSIPVVPRLDWRGDGAKDSRAPEYPDGMDLPKTIEDMHTWIKLFGEHTRVALDGVGKSEGIVLRSMDRTTIAKARFEDYERTLKRRRTPLQGSGYTAAELLGGK